MGANLKPCSHFSASSSRVLDLDPLIGNGFDSNPDFNGTLSIGAACSKIVADGAILFEVWDQGIHLLWVRAVSRWESGGSMILSQVLS